MPQTARTGEAAPARHFSGERGQPGFGVCRVVFSPIPILNDVGSKLPFYLPRESKEISIAEEALPKRFWTRIAAAADATSSQSVVLFVHGYNYGFTRTCRMAAEMQRTLGGKATVLMLSWPSNGLPTDYLPDQVDVEWSVPFLAELLAELGRRVGPAKLRLLAHSMGSRGAFFALSRLAAESAQRPLVDQLVLLAPDFDAETFVDLLPRLVPLAGRITLYASGNDTPLKVSRQLNGHPRLGEAGEHLTVTEAVETIDVSPVGRYQLLGHEYFYSHPLVVADLARLLGEGAGAAVRPGLKPRARDGLPYWELHDQR